MIPAVQPSVSHSVGSLQVIFPQLLLEPVGLLHQDLKHRHKWDEEDTNGRKTTANENSLSSRLLGEGG